MDNRVIFGLGVGLGAIVGSVTTYFALKQRFEDAVDEEIDNYAKLCTERIDDLISYYEGGASAEKELKEDDTSKEPEEFRNNEGVKKYHHYGDSSFGSDNVQSIFSKDNVKEVAGAVRFKTDEERSESEEEKVTEGQKDILKRPQLDDVPGVEEITSEEWDVLDDDEYTRVYLQYDINEDKLYTNDGDIAEEAYAKMRHELIGNCWRWATDYWNEETGEGDFWIKNDNLKIAFQVGLDWDPDAEMVEV